MKKKYNTLSDSMKNMEMLSNDCFINNRPYLFISRSYRFAKRSK